MQPQDRGRLAPVNLPLADLYAIKGAPPSRSAAGARRSVQGARRSYLFASRSISPLASWSCIWSPRARISWARARQSFWWSVFMRPSFGHAGRRACDGDHIPAASAEMPFGYSEMAVGGNFWSLIGGYALPWGRAATTEIYPNSHRIASTAITNSAPAIIVTPDGPSTSKGNSTNSAAHGRHARRSFSSTTRQSSDAARIMTPVSCPAPAWHVDAVTCVKRFTDAPRNLPV
jgi:hypothetical protein